MKKLDTKLDLNKIEQTRFKRSIIPFRDSAIDKITKTTTDFEGRRLKEFSFDVPKSSSLKGSQLRFYRQTGKKSFVISNSWLISNVCPAWQVNSSVTPPVQNLT